MEEKNTLVMKFGGTSVGSLDGLEHVVEIVNQARKEWKQVVVVSSAFSKVTDALLESAKQASHGNLTQFQQTLTMLKERHRQAIQHFQPQDQDRVVAELDVLMQTFSNLIQAIEVLGEATPRALDAVVGLGERLAVRIFITEASSEQSLCFAVPSDMTPAVLAVLEKSLSLEIEQRNIDRIWASEEMVIVTAVCPQMCYRWGVAARIFTALAESEVNVLAIAHGSSEVSISLVVSANYLETTIQAMHALTVNGYGLK